MTYIAPPSIVKLGAEIVIKRFRDAGLCEQEVRWYRTVPWACPELLLVDGLDMVTKRYPVAWETPGWCDPPAVASLLKRVHQAGIAHRDVHLRNVVLKNGQPLLIDWFTAMYHQGGLSYDLFGEASGLPRPDGHLDFQSWNTNNPFSMKEAWGVDLSAVVD
jgi:hypothetical protein